MWQSDPEVWKGCSPVLFPAIGGLKDGGATIDGVFSEVPRHGFARGMEFEVAEQGEDFTRFAVKENEETLKVFPFAFELTITHRFLKNGFETRFEVENRSDKEMPFLMGGHPAFICPMKEGEQFEDYVLHFEKPETCGTTLCDGPGHSLTKAVPMELGEDNRTLSLRYADFDKLDTFILSGLNSRKVDLVHKDTGKGIRFSFDMDVLAIWTSPGKHAPYLCIEPWQGGPAYADETGRFEDKPYHVSLGVGQAYSCGYKMEILD
jgi:galactose mutarotase-like enzyme